MILLTNATPINFIKNVLNYHHQILNANNKAMEIKKIISIAILILILEWLLLNSLQLIVWLFSVHLTRAFVTSLVCLSHLWTQILRKFLFRVDLHFPKFFTGLIGIGQLSLFYLCLSSIDRNDTFLSELTLLPIKLCLFTNCSCYTEGHLLCWLPFFY